MSVQGYKIINCHKIGLATLAQNRFQALTLHPWEQKMHGASVQNILACKYITNMRIEDESVSVKNILACRNLLHPWEQKTHERVHRTFLHANTSHPWIQRLYQWLYRSYPQVKTCPTGYKYENICALAW